MPIVASTPRYGYNVSGATGLSPAPVAAAPLLLDTYPGAAGAYSFRKLRNAYAGSPVRIRDSVGNESDIGFDGSGNFNAAAAATFLGSNTPGTIPKWYDQSGNGLDIAQTTAANQPQYIASGIGSLPGLKFLVANFTRLETATATINTTTVSVLCVSDMDTTNTSAFGRLAAIMAPGDTSDTADIHCSPVILRNNSAIRIDSYNNGFLSNKVIPGANIGCQMTAIFDGANNTCYVNASAGTAVASSNTIGGSGSSNFRIGGNVSDSTYWQGNCTEVLLYLANETSNVSGIYSNQSAYYGI